MVLKYVNKLPDASPFKNGAGRSFKMAEDQDAEITFLPINTSEIRLHVEQPL